VVSFRVGEKPIFSRFSSEVSATQQMRNREKMLGKVERFWIDGVLKNSLHGAALIELGFVFQSDYVHYPWELTLYKGDQVAEPVPKVPTSQIYLLIQTRRYSFSENLERAKLLLS